MRYEFLILDADETLFNFKKAERYALKHSFKDNNIPYNEDIYLKAYIKINTKAWAQLERGEITLAELKPQRFKKLGQEFNLNLDADNFVKCYTKHLAESSFILDGALEFVKKLHKKYRLIILTNGITEVQTKRFNNSPIKEFIEQIIISEAYNLSKPDKRIFDKALSIINCSDKSKALIIGDSLTSDIQGGNNAGIDTLWYNPSRKSNKTHAVPTYEASSYDEILEMLL